MFRLFRYTDTGKYLSDFSGSTSWWYHRFIYAKCNRNWGFIPMAIRSNFDRSLDKYYWCDSFNIYLDVLHANLVPLFCYLYRI